MPDCLYCDDTGLWPPPDAGMGADIPPVPCPMGPHDEVPLWPDDEDDDTEDES